MKKKLFNLGLVLIMGLWSFSALAQDKPAPSPFSKVEQKVGLTDVTIEYSRPSMKDRKIMGGLVPYGKPWRTGANNATKITFSDDVTVEGKELAAGSYALMTIPGENSWDVMFYTYGDRSAGAYADKEPAVKVSVEPVAIDCTVETFLININELRDKSASIQLVWEQTGVPIALGVK